MKKLLFTLCALSRFIASYAQQYQYVPIPTNFATWQTVSVRASSGPPHTSITCHQYNIQHISNGEDTVINGRTYTQVWKRTVERISSVANNNMCPLPNTDTLVAQHPDEFAFGIREENKRVFSSKDTVNPIFDFSAIVGTNLYGFGNVTVIDTINISGTLRQRFITPFDTLIEGIGSIKSGIDPRFFAGWINGTHLTCHTYQNNQLYSYANAPCSVIYPAFPTGIDDVETPENKIYPNPFSQSIHITSGQKLIATLYNAIGHVVLKRDITGNTSVPTGNIANGLYIMILKDATGRTVKTEKLLKQ